MPTIGGSFSANSGTQNRNLLDPSKFSINSAIPGLPGLTSSATAIIKSALNGLPSPSESRLQNAYFGAGSGLDPTSDFLKRRGFDLYRRNAQQKQQQGLGSLLSLISTYSGNVAPTPGQELAANQSQEELGQRKLEFGTNYNFEQQQWQKQLDLLNQFLSGDSFGGNRRNPVTSFVP